MKKNSVIKLGIIAVFLLGLFFLYLPREPEVEIPEPDFSYLVPARNWSLEKPEIKAKSALAVYLDSSGKKKFVFEKEKDLKIPIASITKLMTALIVLENYDLEKTITITEEAFRQDLSRLNNLYFGEQYKVKEILYPLLMESSNTAAYALGQQSNDFVGLMNERAQELGMNSTFFVNSSGLDPLNPTDTANYSSARDVALLVENLLDKEIIWEILSLPEYPLVRSDGFIKHNIVNTNALLQEIPGIMGGKTGTTARALQCFVLVMKKNPDDYLIIVVLGSRNRFQEAKEIISWINNGYYWEII